MVHIRKFGEFGRIDEGAGSGYNVLLEGLALDIDSAVFTGDRQTVGGNEYWKIVVNVGKCVLDKWSTESYYCSITSDGDDDLFFYGDEDRRVDGGTTVWWVLGSDFKAYVSEEYSVGNADISTDKGARYCSECLRKYLRDECDSEVDFGFDYGGGWSHVYLDNPIAVGGKTYGHPKYYYFDHPFAELGQGVLYLLCTEASIDCGNVVGCINDFYKHSIYGEDE